MFSHFFATFATNKQTTMSIIDIIILGVLAFAIYRGVREGLIVQGLSIIGLAVGIWAGMQWGEGVAKIFGIGGQYTAVIGFVIVLIASIIAIGVAARIIRRILKFAGIGFLDIILGAVLSVAKYLLIISLLLSAFDTMNQTISMVDHKHIEGSSLYRPITNISHKWVTPAWEWAEEQIEIPKVEIPKTDKK